MMPDCEVAAWQGEVLLTLTPTSTGEITTRMAPWKAREVARQLIEAAAEVEQHTESSDELLEHPKTSPNR